MNNSPYQNLDKDSWIDKTKELIEDHPLSLGEIEDIAVRAWNILWQTKIGDELTKIPLKDIKLPATVIGYFFEKLFAYILAEQYPDKWCGGSHKEDKDLVYIENPYYSVEIKTSGQKKTDIFGNRSYGKKSQDEVLVKKEKSGYYLTINFYQDTLTLIRFGWIDFEDWQSQSSESGQMSKLKQEVYQTKLFAVSGSYLLRSPLYILEGIGDKKEKELKEQGILKISDLWVIDVCLVEIAEQLNSKYSRLLNFYFYELLEKLKQRKKIVADEKILFLLNKLYISQDNYYNNNKLINKVSWFIL
ncbi:ScaI family restriction endonuclease [Cyanobacterium sp. DS4]|uniref:ScaI family restriction endonuclease n=1 Tax=Cyanobacterium sp. DS4 TaxID=2878255 RepID=UPI002E812A3D|nr:ScaI family restriction endonuclease [Cyanobacterium sp. Dongsha4]WVL00223.1 ScaI family restriction endonuclease [Cyanobacterium sp. Dongsha4]